jgi:hypothetical protein
MRGGWTEDTDRAAFEAYSMTPISKLLTKLLSAPTYQHHLVATLWISHDHARPAVVLRFHAWYLSTIGEWALSR